MEPIIKPREGLPATALKSAMRDTPLTQPGFWCTREQAAAKLGVGPRTVDRYARNSRLTTYRGPLGGSDFGVRIWLDDVMRLLTQKPTVVKP